MTCNGNDKEVSPVEGNPQMPTMSEMAPVDDKDVRKIQTQESLSELLGCCCESK